MNSGIWVHRADLSPYHGPDFQERERRHLEQVAGVRYGALPPGDGPVVLLTNTGTRFDRLPSAWLERCALIVHPNSGYDNLPIDLVQRVGLDIVVGNPIRANAVAAYVLTQILGHFNPSPHSSQWQAGRRWDRRSMASLRVLLLGHGHIGRIVAASLRPLVGSLLVHDPFLGLEVPDLEAAAGDSDVILPLMSLNPTSRNLLSEAVLARLPEDFVLVNGARGDLLDQACLIRLLRSRPRAFAYLDVFAREPFQPSEFAGISNVLLSSHVAGVFADIDDRIIEFEARVIRDFLTLERTAFRSAYESLLLRNRIRGEFLI